MDGGGGAFAAGVAGAGPGAQGSGADGAEEDEAGRGEAGRTRVGGVVDSSGAVSQASVCHPCILVDLLRSGAMIEFDNS